MYVYPADKTFDREAFETLGEAVAFARENYGNYEILSARARENRCAQTPAPRAPKTAGMTLGDFFPKAAHA